LCDLVDDLVAMRPVPAWQGFADQLLNGGRLASIDGYWVAMHRREEFAERDLNDDLVAECLRGHLEHVGPITIDQLIADGPVGGGLLRGAPLSPLRAATAIRRVEAMGFAIELPDGRFCARHLLARLYRASTSARRLRVEAVPLSSYVETLRQVQHVGSGVQLHGRHGVLAIIEQLQGLELAAGDWERHVLAARVADYEPAWLDELCLSGQVTWLRLTPRSATTEPRRGTAHPSASTPLTLCLRADLSVLLAGVRQGESPQPPTLGAAADLYEVLSTQGATFRADLAGLTGRLPAEVDEGLWELVGSGLVTADTFGAVRSLLKPRSASTSRLRRSPAGRLGTHRGLRSSEIGEGRWSLAARAFRLADVLATEALAEDLAAILLDRWGVVSFNHYARESFTLPWRDLARALRRFEAQGLVSGGRFVAGIAGEQFARHDVVQLLSKREGKPPVDVTVCGSDPLNVTGLLLPGARVPAQRNRTVTLRGGMVTETT